MKGIRWRGLLWKRLRNRRGATLIECVLALILFTAVMILTATMFSTANLLTIRTTTLKNSVNDVVNKAEFSDTSANSYLTELHFKGDGLSARIPITIFETESTDSRVSLWKFSPPREGRGGDEE